MPATFAVSAALLAVKEFTLWPQTLRARNATIAELTSVNVWWSGLKLIERRQHAYKEELVTRTEKQLEYESASIAQLAVRYDKQRSSTNGQDDDAATEDNSKSQKKKSKD